MNIYYFFYYCCYKFAKKTRNIDPEFTAMLVLTILMIFDVLGVLLVAHGRRVPISNPKLYGFLIASLVGGVNYLIFIYKKKYKKIISYYDQKPGNNLSRNIGYFLALLFVVLTLICAVMSPKLV